MADWLAFPGECLNEAGDGTFDGALLVSLEAPTAALILDRLRAFEYIMSLMPDDIRLRPTQLRFNCPALAMRRDVPRAIRVMRELRIISATWEDPEISPGSEMAFSLSPEREPQVRMIDTHDTVLGPETTEAVTPWFPAHRMVSLIQDLAKSAPRVVESRWR